MSSIRLKTLVLATASVLLVVALAMLDGSAQAVPLSAQGTVSHSFIMPEHTIVTDDAGFGTFQLAGFPTGGRPGNPELPSALYYIALPPAVPLDTVTLEIDALEQTELPGEYQIAAVGPYFRQVNDQQIENWEPNTATVIYGKNSDVYENDGYFPAQPVELSAVSQMRKWRIAELRVQPISFNPVSGRIRLTTHVDITLRYDMPAMDRASSAELRDGLMDDWAESLFLNFDEAKAWYASLQSDQTTASAREGYAIITTNEIAKDSDQLAGFIRHKTDSGYKVFLVTEEANKEVDGKYLPKAETDPDVETSSYGTTGDLNERPEKVRQWLKDNYLTHNIEYVLLIGDPDPPRVTLKYQEDVVGDLPMKTTWPPGLKIECTHAYAVAAGGDRIAGRGTTKVTCTDLPISVTLTSNPSKLPPTGGDVVFTVVVANNGPSAVTINSLEDDKFGDLNNRCSVPRMIPVGGSFTCNFTGNVKFDGSCIHTNRVTASGTGANDEDEVTNFDEALVTCNDKGLHVTVTAEPAQLPIPGGIVKFDVLVQNTTSTSVKITSLTVFPDKNLNERGSCKLPQTIAAGKTYECSYYDLEEFSDPYQLYGTDHYYADLSGNWDLDGDGMFADPGDYMPGGVDFWPEVIVGRIPVYASRDPGWVDTLDRILLKSEEYETPTVRDWRRSALLPMGFIDQETDAAHLGYAVEKLLIEAGFADEAIHTMYMGTTKCQSELPSVEPLVSGNQNQVSNYWNENPVGIAMMASHGNHRLLTFGQNCPEKDDTVIFDLDGANALPPSLLKKPALAFITGCATEMPGTPDNLAYALLKTGTIGTVSATSSSDYITGWEKPVPARTDQLSLAYNYIRDVVLNDHSTGESLFAATLSPTNKRNALAFNLFGDPGLKLMLSRPLSGDDRYDVAKERPLVVSAPGVLADDIEANGDPRVYYFSENRLQPRIQELSGRYITWQNQEVAADVYPPPSILSPLAATSVQGRPRIYYRAIGGHIHELAYDGEAWNDRDLTGESGAPPVGGWSLAAISTNSDPRVYYFAKDWHVHELAQVSNSWRDRDLTKDAGGPKAAGGNPLSVTTITNGDPRVFYVTADQHIHELAYRSLTRVWSHGDLTAISGAPACIGLPVGRSALTSTTVNSLPRVYFLGVDRHVYELKWGKETDYRYVYTDVTDEAGSTVLAYADSTLAAVATDDAEVPRVYYLAPYGDISHVHQLVWSEEDKLWYDIDVTEQAEGPPAVEDSPLAAVAIGHRPRVYYLDAERRVHELAILDQVWQHGAVGTAAGAPAATFGSALVATSAGDSQLTASLVSGVSHGALTLNPDGSFSYTPKANFPETGYSATDSFVYMTNDGFADSSEATVLLEVTDECAPADYNLIRNYCFAEAKTPWKFWHNNRSLGSYTISEEDPFAGTHSAKIEIDSPGNNIQLYQSGIDMQANTTYELSFAAYSDDGRNMKVYVHRHNHDGTYTNFGLRGERVDLEPYWKWFTMTFTTPDLLDLTDGRLRFWFAPFAREGTVYHIDRVLLRPVSNP